MRLILLAILCITIFAVPPEAVIHEAWTHYEIDVQGREYPFSAETNATYDAFKANYITLDAFIEDKKGATYDLGLNLYSDLSQAQFATAHLLQGITPYQNARGLDTSALPDTKSWQDVIFQAAPQEAGPDSWAYAAVAAVEAFFNRKKTTPADYIHLSIQQVIDCVTNKTTIGALTWIQNNGIELNATYTKGNCAPTTLDYKIPTIRLVQADGDELKAALQFNPVTVCFDLTNFQQYKNGVINQDCDDTKINYCGLLYGYEGEEWIIKTSLGPQWGVEGQVRILHGALCGVSKVAAFPMSFGEDIESYRDNFNAYKVKFGKTYATPEEEASRFQTYAYALMDGGDFVGETQFTDWTVAEFKDKYLLTGVTMQNSFKLDDYIITADGDIDWRDENIVSDVTEQGDCKSSWAIASKNALEAYFRQQTSKNVELSLQQLIDCSDPLLPKQGCTNGSPSHALSYGTAKGLIWESKYPYVGQAQDCQQVQGATLRPSNFAKLTEAAAIAAALKKRPVVVCFTASNLQNYVQGVVTQEDCGTDANNYCGLLVGKTDEYWIVQGSFGTTWGIDGYVHIQYGNNCGITGNAYAII